MASYMAKKQVLWATSKNIGYFLEPHHSIVEWDSWVDFPLARLDSKEIGYFLEYDHTIEEWVDYPLTGLDPNEIGYFLESDHSIVVVVGFYYHSKVGFPLVKVAPKKIGYLLEHDKWVDCLMMELGPNNIG